MSNYVANDQYGHSLYLDSHPRKELMARHGVKHAERMFVDREDGSYHVGYVVAGHWYTVLGLEGHTFARKV